MFFFPRRQATVQLDDYGDHIIMDNAPIIDHNRTGGLLAEWLDAGAHQMEPPCPLIS